MQFFKTLLKITWLKCRPLLITKSWSRSRKLSMALRVIAGGMAATSCRILLLIWLYNSLQSFGLLNQIFPFSSVLSKGLPVWYFYLLYIFSNIILPACFWSSYWPSWKGFPGVNFLYHSRTLHPFNVTEPAQSLCSDEVYYVLTFVLPPLIVQ